jgi:hypothetical protein
VLGREVPLHPEDRLLVPAHQPPLADVTGTVRGQQGVDLRTVGGLPFHGGQDGEITVAVRKDLIDGRHPT